MIHSVDIYRSGVDCTNHGVTHPERSAGKRVYLITDPADVLNIPKGDHIVLVLHKKMVGDVPYFTAKPLGEKSWCMMGGNFIYTCDSRFREICQYPIPVHDRIE
jgi:hypothetical protein